MKTWVSDNFPFRGLECYYFEICKDYNPLRCFLEKSNSCESRKTLNKLLENYVRRNNLKTQIREILLEKENLI